MAVEIPVKIGRQTKWISGIVERTTCNDILIGVLMSEKLLDCPESEVGNYFALVEMWRSVSKVLSGSSPILRIWIAWAAEQPQVVFVVKRIRRPKVIQNLNMETSPLEQMRKYVREQEEKYTGSVNRRKLGRRNSSISRSSHKIPDTFHPRKAGRKREDMEQVKEQEKCKTTEEASPDCSHRPAVRSDHEGGVLPLAGKRKQELCQSIGQKMRLMVEQSETIKKEILKLQLMNLEQSPLPTAPIQQVFHLQTMVADTSQDTSEDSGIVTDDSDAKGYYQNVKTKVKPRSGQADGMRIQPDREVFSESDLCSKLVPPPDDPKLYEWVSAMEQIEKLNKALEEKEEQIVALSYEYKMLVEDDSLTDPVLSPLDCFNAEVSKYRDINANLLAEITQNKMKIETSTKEGIKFQGEVDQMEYEMSVVDEEGDRLEFGLQEIESILLDIEKEDLAREDNLSRPIINSDFKYPRNKRDCSPGLNSTLV